MLKKAHHHSANRIAGRRGRLAAVALMCVLSIVLALCSAANAAAPASATLGAVAQTTTQELTATAGTTVGQVAGAAPALRSPSAADQPTAPDSRAAPMQQAAPADAPAGAPANTAALHPPGEAHEAVAAGVVQQARDRIGSASDTSRSEGRGAIHTIVHAATAGVGGSPRAAPVTGVVQALTSSRSGGVVRALSRTVASAAGSSRVVQTLAYDTSTLTATVAHGTRLLGAIERLTSSVAGPALGTLQAIARVAVAHPLEAALAQERAAGPPLAAASPASTSNVLQSRSGWQLAPLTAVAQNDFGGWIAWAAIPSVRVSAAIPIVAEALPSTRVLPGVQSAVLFTAHGGHRTPLPASLASTPSPGGVSPAAAVGVGAGLSIALTLAALLMLAAPLAVRRLRLDGESWRLAPLQLIADHPG